MLGIHLTLLCPQLIDFYSMRWNENYERLFYSPRSSFDFSRPQNLWTRPGRLWSMITKWCCITHWYLPKNSVNINYSIFVIKTLKRMFLEILKKKWTRLEMNQADLWHTNPRENFMVLKFLASVLLILVTLLQLTDINDIFWDAKNRIPRKPSSHGNVNSMRCISFIKIKFWSTRKGVSIKQEANEDQQIVSNEQNP